MKRCWKCKAKDSRKLYGVYCFVCGAPPSPDDPPPGGYDSGKSKKSKGSRRRHESGEKVISRMIGLL